MFRHTSGTTARSVGLLVGIVGCLLVFAAWGADVTVGYGEDKVVNLSKLYDRQALLSFGETLLICGVLFAGFGFLRDGMEEEGKKSETKPEPAVQSPPPLPHNWVHVGPVRMAKPVPTAKPLR